MKFFAISDLHLNFSGEKPMDIFGGNWDNYQQKIAECWQKNVCEEDVVVVAGDISWAMQIADAQIDLDYFSKLNGKKIFVRGNHDYWWKSISAVREVMPSGCFALQNDAIKFGNKVFAGSRGYVAKENGFLDDHHEKIYSRELIRIEMALNCATKLKEDGDEIVFVMHYPPFNSKKEQNEVIDLFKKFGVSTCIYGHLHKNPYNYKLHENVFGINFFLTSCDLVNNQLIKID